MRKGGKVSMLIQWKTARLCYIVWYVFITIGFIGVLNLIKVLPVAASAVLVIASTDVDKTGASYYGEQTLHYIAANGESAAVQLREYSLPPSCGQGHDTGGGLRPRSVTRLPCFVTSKRNSAGCRNSVISRQTSLCQNPVTLVMLVV